jgi:hypothetical protein
VKSSVSKRIAAALTAMQLPFFSDELKHRMPDGNRCSMNYPRED